MGTTVRYRKTGIGSIPEDWRLVSLRAIVRDNRVPSGIYKSKNLYGRGTKIIKISDVFAYDHYVPEVAQRVELTDEEALRYRVETGDIVIALASVKLEGVGKVMLVDKLDERTAFDHNVALIRLVEGISGTYVFYLLESEVIRKKIGSLATQVGTTFLKTSTILDFPIPFPPTKAEQQAIAVALSDTDDLIAGLEQLITKKRAVKQATMQQLLTGKTRLPSFDGGWETKVLGEIVDIVSGGTPRTTVEEYWNGGINWCTPTDITATDGKYLYNTTRTISASGLSSCSARLLPIGTLLLCSRATIGEVKIAGQELCTNQGFKSLICGQYVYSEYLYYVLQIMKPLMLEKAIGSTFLEISKRDTANLEVKLPSLQEQHAIAAVLSDMDAEIGALEHKRDKTRAIKQGMMQELLTGRIRLV